MTGSQCLPSHVGLAVTLVALAVSLCLNVIFCLLQRRDRRRTGLKAHFVSSEPTEQYSEGEHECLQENPIYGNIHPERAAAQGLNLQDHVLYEHMQTQPATETTYPQSVQLDVSYASLDLAGAKKFRKKCKAKQGQAQTKRLPHSLSQQGFLEADAEMEANLPSRQSSPMVSRHSIYLNSRQMALEAQELEREQQREREWERQQEREWETDPEQERNRQREREWETDPEQERNRQREREWETDAEQERNWQREQEWETDAQQERDWQREAAQLISGPDYDAVHDDPTRFFRCGQNQDFEIDNL
ncbi:hypothetical protein GN956_G24702 [Arapaima gigas]